MSRRRTSVEKFNKILVSARCTLYLTRLITRYRKRKRESRKREGSLSSILLRLPGVASFMERCWARAAFVDRPFSMRRPGIGQPWNDRPPPRLNGFSHRLYEEINVLASVWQNNESKNGRGENTPSQVFLLSVLMMRSFVGPSLLYFRLCQFDMDSLSPLIILFNNNVEPGLMYRGDFACLLTSIWNCRALNVANADWSDKSGVDNHSSCLAPALSVTFYKKRI